MAIDVKPVLNLNSQGTIDVTLFSTDTFDATTVDLNSVVFAYALAVGSQLKDVDGDGHLDLVLTYNVQDTNLGAIYDQLLLNDMNDDGVLDSSREEARFRWSEAQSMARTSSEATPSTSSSPAKPFATCWTSCFPNGRNRPVDPEGTPQPPKQKPSPADTRPGRSVCARTGWFYSTANHISRERFGPCCLPLG